MINQYFPCSTDGIGMSFADIMNDPCRKMIYSSSIASGYDPLTGEFLPRYYCAFEDGRRYEIDPVTRQVKR